MNKHQQCKGLERGHSARENLSPKALMEKSLGCSRNIKEIGRVGGKELGRLVLGEVGIG